VLPLPAVVRGWLRWANAELRALRAVADDPLALAAAHPAQAVLA